MLYETPTFINVYCLLRIVFHTDKGGRHKKRKAQYSLAHLLFPKKRLTNFLISSSFLSEAYFSFGNMPVNSSSAIITLADRFFAF